MLALSETGVRNVLLVDDEGSICDVIRDIIKSLAPGEVDLICVHSDTAAYRAFAEGQFFDSILMDTNLGRGRTSYDVARRARSLRPDAKVVFISGQIDERSAADLAVPGSTFLQKPFTSEQLFIALGLKAP